MKALLQTTTLFIYLSIYSIPCAFQVEALSIPDGYLLGFKVVQVDDDPTIPDYNHISLFTIHFNGTVTENWNYSESSSNTLYFESLLAVDLDDKLVYLGSPNELLALDLTTGTEKVKIPLKSPNLQYFCTYDYFAKDKAVYGACSGSIQWNWCRIKQNGAEEASLDMLYHLPFTNEYGPSEDVYYFDAEDETIWYYPPSAVHEYVVGINFSSGQVLFESGANPNGTEDLCIAHDRTLGRVFAYVWNSTNFTAVGLSELFPKPKQRKILLKLPLDLGDFRPTNFGTCDYDQMTHTLIGLMVAKTGDNLMPTHLLFIDVIDLTYKLVPLPVFQEKWGPSDKPITIIKYIAH